MQKANGPLASERRLRILDQVEASGSVRVAALAEQFSVAEETIRRDLERLGSEGRVLRTHGGALRVRDDMQDQPISVRQSANVVEKQQIGRRAAARVSAGDVIALDASSTAIAMATALPDISITVVTNGLEAARLLAHREHIRVTLIGGQMDAASMCLLGPIAELNLRQFAVTQAFVSCKGIDPERGLSEASAEHASLKRWMLEGAEETCLIADHSKFGVRSVAFFGMLSDVDTLITDAGTDAELLEPLAGLGVTALIAE